MPVQKVNIDTFLQLAAEIPVIDVRSPSEFVHAHFPKAYSLPLFTDEERKVVGTAYKQQGKQKAIKIGLDYFGKKMVKMVDEAEEWLSKTNSTHNQEKTLLVHCWRGGMRSAGVAWLLDLYGYKVYTLEGGYKAFRNWVLHQFENDYPFKILGGFTGSGKTEVLAQLKKRGQKIIDLEDLAHHKGSAFGAIGMPDQPSQEMFENKLALELFNINNENRSEPIWLEDESQRIGAVNIPHGIWRQMRNKSLIFLNIPFEERLNYIVQGYGKGDKEKLINAVVRIKKRLGPLETKTAVNYLLEDDLKESFRVLLTYYDKHYLKGRENRENPQEIITDIQAEKVDAVLNASSILANQLQH